MTATATAAVTSSTTVLDELLAELDSVSLDNAQLSRDSKKCEHYHLLGPVDDHTRRLMLLGDQKIVALDALRDAAQREGEQLVNDLEAAYEAADDNAKRKLTDDVQLKLGAITNRLDQEAKPHKLRLSILRALLQLEVERQYPAVVGKERIIYNQDCTVGYIDHGDALKQTIQNLEANGFGLVGEIVGMGHLFGRGGFGVHAGH